MPASPGTVIPSGTGVSPGGDIGLQGPTAVSTDANNLATLGSDNKILVPASSIWSVRLRSFNATGNPNFEVSQRNTGAQVTNNTNWVEDRWTVGKVGSMTVNTLLQAATPVVPGTNFRLSGTAAKISIGTQETTLAAGDFFTLQQTVEGPLFRELSNDVHSISLLIYCDVAVNFALGLRDPSSARSLTKLCSVPATTWTLIQLPNLPIWASGGTFSVAAGTVGYQLTLCLACGSTYTAPANDTWQNGNFVGAVGQSNFFSNAVGTSFYIGFVQHEPGSQCTTLIDKAFTQNYDECLRYYCKSYPYAILAGGAGSTAFQYGHRFHADTTAQTSGGPYFPKRMAQSPTIRVWNPSNSAINSGYDLTGGAAAPISSVNLVTEANLCGVAGTFVAGHGYLLAWDADTGW